MPTSRDARKILKQIEHLTEPDKDFKPVNPLLAAFAIMFIILIVGILLQ